MIVSGGKLDTLAGPVGYFKEKRSPNGPRGGGKMNHDWPTRPIMVQLVPALGAFGHLLPPFGAIWAPLGHLLGTFWLHLAPFRHHLGFRLASGVFALRVFHHWLGQAPFVGAA